MVAAPRPSVTRRATALAFAVALASAAPTPADVIPVTTLSDLDVAEGACSLREAIVAANTDGPYQDCPAGDGADEVTLAVPGTILLAADLPLIDESLTLRGLGSAVSRIDGGGTHRLLDFATGLPGAGELLRVEGLELTGGAASQGGAIYAGPDRSLEVVDCVLAGNRAVIEGGAIRGNRATSVVVERSQLSGNVSEARGGAISVQGGELRVVDSTLSGNDAEGGHGGGIYAILADSVLVLRSTLSDNSATQDGGGVASVVSDLRLESSTVVANEADADDGNDGDGGGMAIAGGATTATLVSTVLAGNTDSTTAGISCADGFRKLGAVVATEGFNLVGVNDCVDTAFPAGLPNLSGDLVGTAAAPVDPLLGALEPNGGPTPTHPPLPGSPVLDQGSCPGAVSDQRGFGNGVTLLRIVDDPAVPSLGDGCDVGAVEIHTLELAGLVFYDGFESGELSRWSAATP